MILPVAASSTSHDGGRRRASRAWVGLIVLLVVIAAAAVLAARATGPTAPGPLRSNDPEGIDGNGLASLRVGESRCYGFVQIANPTDEPATITNVSVHDEDGLRVGPITVLSANRSEFLYATAASCPSGGEPAEGYTIPPDNQASGPKNYGVELLIPVTVVDPGEHRLTGVIITYRYKGRTFQVKQLSDLQMCTTACRIGPA